MKAGALRKDSVIGEGFRPGVEVKELDESAEQRGFTAAVFSIDQQILASEVEGVCAWAGKGTKVLDLDFHGYDLLSWVG